MSLDHIAMKTRTLIDSDYAIDNTANGTTLPPTGPAARSPSQEPRSMPPGPGLRSASSPSDRHSDGKAVLRGTPLRVARFPIPRYREF